MHIQVINFRLKDLSPAGYAALCDELAPNFAAMPGLLAKVWLADDASGTYGGVYTWRDRAAMGEALGGVQSSYVGPAYRFPSELPAPIVETTRLAYGELHLLGRMGWNVNAEAEQFAAREPYVAVIADGAVVSVCFCARLTDRAAEAGLETLEGYRGRGYGPAVTAAWARAIRASGRIPLYSTSWDNLASQAVAGKLGLVQYATDLSLG